MDPVRNPFAPGAGAQPPQLAGRDEIIEAAEIALQRALIARHDKSQILLGLRGTGKTVLLNKIEQLAESHYHLTSFIEAPNDSRLVEMLYPKIQQVLRKLSVREYAKARVHQAFGALKSFAKVFKISAGGVEITVEPAAGVADSGILEYDLTDLFISVGEAAQSAERGWTLLIDEVQYLNEEELSALIVAIHRVNQKKLPIMFFGAGLPQIAALSGNAKSYAERLFDFPPVGPLDRIAAHSAIKQPIVSEGESITEKALDLIFEQTQGYPYFLQEWGYQAWNVAEFSPISRSLVEMAGQMAIQRLDEGFFKVRYERLTPSEKEYVQAMASLGEGPYRSSDVADALGKTIQSLGPRRARIIHKGMIYSASHGDIDFTVPFFHDYLNRHNLLPGS